MTSVTSVHLLEEIQVFQPQRHGQMFSDHLAKIRYTLVVVLLLDIIINVLEDFREMIIEPILVVQTRSRSLWWFRQTRSIRPRGVEL